MQAFSRDVTPNAVLREQKVAILSDSSETLRICEYRPKRLSVREVESLRQTDLAFTQPKRVVCVSSRTREINSQYESGQGPCTYMDSICDEN